MKRIEMKKKLIIESCKFCCFYKELAFDEICKHPDRHIEERSIGYPILRMDDGKYTLGKICLQCPLETVK